MTDRTATARAFLAIEMDSPIHAALVQLKLALAGTGAEVRWVGDGGLHATVKFLGSVPYDVLEGIRRALAEALRSFPTFSVQVRGLGVFPTPSRPRVLWVGVAAPELPQLARQVDTAAAPFGFAVESRPFRGHITLGRVKSPRGWSRLEAALQERWGEGFGTCEVRELIGYRSDLRPGGAIYTKLWTVPLASSKGG